MAIPGMTLVVSAVKDAIHIEWTDFKKSNRVERESVCLYAIGGQRDTPFAVLRSVSKGVCAWETGLKEIRDDRVERNRGVVATEVSVGADGRIFLYPEPLHKLALPVGTLPQVCVTQPGPRSRQTPEMAFMTTIEQTANYMIDHLKRVSEGSLTNGKVQTLKGILASLTLIRGRMGAYKDILKTPETKAFTDTTLRCTEVINFMMHNILCYHSNLLQISILHDAASHDWSNVKCYNDNDRSALCLQMWGCYMQGLRNDLWRYTSPKIAESIFASVLTDTLSILVTRYAQVEPSEMRLHQYRADVVTILATVASFLPCLTSSPAMLFSVRIHQSVAFTIHRRMECFLKIAAVKSAPVESLAKVFKKGVDAVVKRSGYPQSPIAIRLTPEWLTFLNPTLFPDSIRSLHTLPDNCAVYLTLLTAASRPQPQWSLIIRGLLMRRYKGARIILNGLQDIPDSISGGQACQGVMCLPHLCTPPLIAQTVYAAILKIIVDCVTWTPILSKLIGVSIKKSANLSFLDRSQVWNIQRPPWLHGLIAVIIPHIVGVVAQVMKKIPPQPPAQPAHPSQKSVRLEHHLSAWTLQLLTGLEDVADDIPTTVIQLAQMISDALPQMVKPTGGHVITQLVVSALYSIVNNRGSLDQLCESPITDGQWDMMVAIGERICSLHDGIYDNHLKLLTEALLAHLEDLIETEREDLDEWIDEDVIDSVFTALSSSVLSSCQGQHVLLMVWEFLKRNMEWLQKGLSVTSFVPLTENSKDKFQPILSFKQLPDVFNPLYYYNHVLYTAMDQASIMDFSSDWETILRSDLCLPKETLNRLIKSRPEFQNGAILTDSENVAVTQLRKLMNLND